MAPTTLLPTRQPDTTPGLLYPPAWHQQQDTEERAWLDAFILDPSLAVTLWKAHR